MSKENVLVGLIVLLVLGGLGVQLKKDAPQVVVNVPEPTVNNVGAVAVLNSPIDVGTGGALLGGGKRFNVGARTLYDIQMPNATTTGVLSCSILNNESYTVNVRMGWGLTYGATTTALSDIMTIGSKATVNLSASTSFNFIAPNGHVVLNLAGTTTDVTSQHNPSGCCTFIGSSF